MKKMFLLAFCLFLLGACGNTSAGGNDELLISTASSLSGAMQSIKEDFQKQYPDIKLAFNYGSSSKLSNQLQQGAPADVFLSASEDDMDRLIQKKIIIEETVVNFARNELVLASSRILPSQDLDDLLADEDMLFAVGEPDSVPLGFYTKEALMNLGLWEMIDDQVIFAKDARQVLSYVESENTEAGFVYASDARISTQIETIIEVHGNEQIIYPAAVVESTVNREAADKFLGFLLSDKGQQIFKDYGFTTAKGDLP